MARPRPAWLRLDDRDDGGLWDSLLVEGKGWWITPNSDSHKNYRDTSVTGGSIEDFERLGRYPDPVDWGESQVDYGDFDPGRYSRTWVEASGDAWSVVGKSLATRIEQSEECYAAEEVPLFPW